MNSSDFIKTKMSLMGLIYDINENEIMSHVEDGTLKQWITTWRRCVFDCADKLTIEPIGEDNEMTIIFAKHDGCDKEFIFEVPAGMYPVRNDILWVDTAYGETVAIATSDTIFGHRVEQIVERFGAYLPLKKVKAYANKGIQAYIENRTYKEVGAFCQDRQVNVHELEDLPF